MDTGFWRLVIITGVLLILTADYTTIVSQILGAMAAIRAPKSSQQQIQQIPTRDLRTETVDDSDEAITVSLRTRLLGTIKNACLPKLICELHANTEKNQLSETERSLLALIRDTSISTTAEVPSKYHYAAHMGQLIAGMDGTGCHNFYPTCPFAGVQVMQMVKKIRIR